MATLPRNMRRAVALFIVFVAVAFAHRRLGVVVVDGSSMSPTIFDGQTCLLVRGMSFSTGDVVAAVDPSGEEVVKRVGSMDGGVFLLGDNGTVSIDSRAYGRIEPRMVMGRVFPVPRSRSVLHN